MAQLQPPVCIHCQMEQREDGTVLAQKTGMSETKALQLSDFSYLDQKEFQAKYVVGDRIRFYVEGVSCGKCVRKIEDLSLKVPGVLRIRVDLGSNLAHAEIDSSQISFADLAGKIQELGFNPIPLAPESSAEQMQKSEDRGELIRLAVAGACAGNIMLFSFANYLGASSEFFEIFSWLSFLLYLPVVLYVAQPFYRGALKSLRIRQISIDLPMAAASVAGFVFSTVELLRGRNDIYFDSLSGFLFLILISRWLQKRMQRRFLRPQELMESLRLERTRRVTESGWVWTPVEALKRGERFLLCAPETLPAEAELVSSVAHFSLAWLSGESRPKTFLRGSVIPAGARLISGEIQLIARKPLQETSFGQILNQVQNYSLTNNRAVSLSDRWAQWLLGIVLFVGVVFLSAYWTISPEEAVQRALALIILACPCAMAFGTPLALASSLRKAQRRGLVVRTADVFEKCARIRTVYFDKTGTLTDSDLSLKVWHGTAPLVYQKIVLALENESMHPIAFAFRREFENFDVLPPVDGAREIPGTGVSGFIYGKFYELRKNSKPGLEIGCTLFEDEQPVLDFSFEAKLKPRVREVLDLLRADGLAVRLLSGDTSEVSQRLGKELGFVVDDVTSESGPEAKAAVVSQTPTAMMIGDGVNDALAMSRASVGVAVSGGMETALKSADVYLTESSLEGVHELFAISRDCVALIKRNLTISVLYNCAGGTLALLGYINPLAAAVLMPVSSGFILLSTWINGRGK